MSKSKTPVKDDDTDSSYTSESMSHQQSSTKGKKRSGKKSHYTETESSISMSGATDSNPKAMAAQLKHYMKNDYNVSVSASGGIGRRSKGPSGASDDEDTSSYS